VSEGSWLAMCLLGLWFVEMRMGCAMLVLGP